MQAIDESTALWTKVKLGVADQLILGQLDMKDAKIAAYGASIAASMPQNQPAPFGLSLVVYNGRDRHWELATEDVDPPTYDTQRLKQENQDLRAQVKNLNDILTD